MSACLVAPGSLIELRTLSIDHVAPGESRTVDLEVLAATAVPECRFGRRDSAAALGTVDVSFDAGATWATVPDAGGGAIAGPNLGALGAGDRIPVKVRLTLPAATPGVVLARSRSIGLVLGFGTSPGWTDSSLVADYGLFTDPNAGPSPSADMGTF